MKRGEVFANTETRGFQPEEGRLMLRKIYRPDGDNWEVDNVGLQYFTKIEPGKAGWQAFVIASQIPRDGDASMENSRCTDTATDGWVIDYGYMIVEHSLATDEDLFQIFSMVYAGLVELRGDNAGRTLMASLNRCFEDYSLKQEEKVRLRRVAQRCIEGRNTV